MGKSSTIVSIVALKISLKVGIEPFFLAASEVKLRPKRVMSYKIFIKIL